MARTRRWSSITGLQVRRRVLYAAVFVTFVALAGSGFGTRQEVAGLFRQARFGEALSALPTLEADGRPGENLLWQVRLETDPDAMLELCRSALAEHDLPEAARRQFVYHAASVEFARGAHRKALALLLPALDSGDQIPGAFYLLCGLSYRALGATQRAREMLASVRVGDPAFLGARYELGRIGLQTNDTNLALRYFESASRQDDADRLPSLRLGRWEALKASEQETEAAAEARELMREHPRSLAALVLGDLMRTEQEQSEAERMQTALATPETTTAPASQADRGTRGAPYTSIQLAAFSDRSLALAFQERCRPLLADVRIDREQGPDGHFLYKVRTGRYAGRAQAVAEAERIGDTLGIEVLVVEVSP
jgi:tetratricopeptide (TPR) repeat protein